MGITQEDKNLLLKDLCARLPYGVKGHYKYYDIIGGSECLTDENDGDITSIDINLGNPIKINGYYTEVDYVKPYLRPLSSMTDEEKDYMYRKFGWSYDDGYSWLQIEAWNYLYSIHIDVHGLIDKDLALEAPEGMYK